MPKSWMKPSIAIFLIGIFVFFELNALERTATWKALYSAVQAANQVTISEAKPPLACALGPEVVPASLESLRTAVSVYEAHPDQRVNIMRLAGQAYCWLGKNEQARTLLEGALAQEPSDGISALQLAAIYWKAGDEQALNDILALKAISEVDLLSAADYFSRENDLQFASDWCNFAVQADPSMAQTWACLRSVASKYEQQNEWQKASDLYQSALLAQEKHGVGIYQASFLYRLGYSYEHLDDPVLKQAAGAYYDRALSDGRFFNDKENADAFENRADWRRTMKTGFTTELYLADYQQAVALNPKATASILWIGRIYLDEYDAPGQAAEYFQKAITVAPNNPSAYFYLGIALSKQSDWAGAVQAFESAVQKKPDWKAAQDRLADAREKLGQQKTP